MTYTIVVVDERNPTKAPMSEMTPQAVGAQLTTGLNAEMTRLAIPNTAEVQPMGMDFSKDINTRRHYFLAIY